ncbi:MAG: DUF4233 domain-containing protein [Hamadaea sp.]|uniref:DUF4233 domain-containing protein n=1 Tax=Hamadaea sp. NPDC050747 TaxID=3155789 RepID=UPI0017E9DB6C|nr:DUF4233 domain-containing protein [Hamadaea sp.]NUR50256.1 DUF4233 domain-containing protein [Hamadaea sp.]
MTEVKPSGLRNPEKAVRGLGAAALSLEGITLLLGIAPIRMLGTGHPTAAIIILIVAAVVAFTLVGMMGRPWAWHAAGALQLALIVGGLAHWMIAAVGVTFGLAWLYVLKVRRQILS